MLHVNCTTEHTLHTITNLHTHMLHVSCTTEHTLHTITNLHTHMLHVSCTIQHNTIQYNIFISPLSSHINTERKRKQKIKHAENCASFSICLSLWFRRLRDVILLRKYGGEVSIRGDPVLEVATFTVI